jgi:ubiquinone/menaquinone biosynthesis C-methylase UbiE
MTLTFDDSEAYERFVGKWGRRAGAIFLDWLDPPDGAAWLEIGCGTGLFTDLIVETCSPASVVGIDPAQAQIDYASRKPVAGRARFRLGDAQALPFPEAAFDIVASALVINFIPDRVRALSEMRRVIRPGGLVAGYVWDFEPELSPSGPFRLGLRDVIADLPALPGTNDSTVPRIQRLFEQAGFVDVATRHIDVTVEFADFEAFWAAQTPSYAPTTKTIAAMGEADRRRLEDAVRSRLRATADGSIRYGARANAIRGRAPDPGTAV